MPDDSAVLRNAAAATANFEAIHARLIATEPGRRFLAEFARRNALTPKRQQTASPQTASQQTERQPSEGQYGEGQPGDSQILAHAVSLLSAAARDGGPPMSPVSPHDLIAAATGLRDLAARIESMVGLPRAEDGVGDEATSQADKPEAHKVEASNVEAVNVEARIVSAAPTVAPSQDATAVGPDVDTAEDHRDRDFRNAPAVIPIAATLRSNREATASAAMAALRALNEAELAALFG